MMDLVTIVIDIPISNQVERFLFVTASQKETSPLQDQKLGTILSTLENF